MSTLEADMGGDGAGGTVLARLGNLECRLPPADEDWPAGAGRLAPAHEDRRVTTPAPIRRALRDALHRAGSTLVLCGALPCGRERWTGEAVGIGIATRTCHNVEGTGRAERSRHADRTMIELGDDGDRARTRWPRSRSRARERQLRLPW